MPQKLNVLYVEDNEGDVMLFDLSWDRYCRDFDVNFDTKETVEDAICALNKKSYCAAILDWNLPDGTCLDIAEHIRKSDPKMALIFLSGVVTDDLKVEASPYCPTCILEKEYSKDHMEAIATILAAITNPKCEAKSS